MTSLIKSIKTGNFELLESGILQVLSKEVTVIDFDSIMITFEFETNSSEPESSIKVNTTEQNTIKFKLVNINNPTYGITDFVRFASLADGSDAFISFKVNSLNDKNVRSLEYSIFKKNV